MGQVLEERRIKNRRFQRPGRVEERAGDRPKTRVVVRVEWHHVVLHDASIMKAEERRLQPALRGRRSAVDRRDLQRELRRYETLTVS